MCGIYSVYLKKNDEAGKKVLEGLKRLEYRGYDSWGVAVFAEGKIVTDKHIGKIGRVEKIAVPSAAISLGHTRWATHGGVTDTNAHPHAASDGSFVLVQNGVVENFQELKEMLKNNGHVFISQTDTEVIVRLIEELGKEKKEVISFGLIARAFQQLDGRNTIGVLTNTGNVYAIRNGSPLVVAKDAVGNIFLSSDVLSVAADATEYMALESGQGVVIEEGKLKLFSVNEDKELGVAFQPIDVESTQLDKAGFPHFMLKEIHEQADVLTAPLKTAEKTFQEFAQVLRSARNVYTVGAGSADFVSTQIAFFLREVGVRALAVKSYESKSFMDLVSSEDICIAVSQSGETADTVEVIEWMKEKGVKIASIVNMPGSTITRLSEYPFMLQIGPEIGIASTKAVSSQMIWGKTVAKIISGETLAACQKAVAEYQNQLQSWFKDTKIQSQLKQLAHSLKEKKDVFILGRGQLYMPALESALKLKEISYLHAEGFSGGELKHGVIALIEKGTPVFCLIANDGEKADMMSATAEVKARGAHVIGVATEHNDLFDEWIAVPPNDNFAFVSSFLPAQLLTYHIAVAKNLDPDKPRNLAKSVTVK